MEWHTCLSEQFSKADAVHAVEPNATPTDAEFQSPLSLEYLELKLAVREVYFDFDWKSWAKAACLVQKEAECFYANHLLSDDFQTISQARALDMDLTEVLTIARQLMVDLGPRVDSLSQTLNELQKRPSNAKNRILQQDGQGEVELNVVQFTSAWQEFLTHVVSLEGLSRDIKLAYSSIAVDAAQQNQNQQREETPG